MIWIYRSLRRYFSFSPQTAQQSNQSPMSLTSDASSPRSYVSPRISTPQTNAGPLKPLLSTQSVISQPKVWRRPPSVASTCVTYVQEVFALRRWAACPCRSPTVLISMVEPPTSIHTTVIHTTRRQDRGSTDRRGVGRGRTVVLWSLFRR